MTKRPSGQATLKRFERARGEETRRVQGSVHPHYVSRAGKANFLRSAAYRQQVAQSSSPRSGPCQPFDPTELSLHLASNAATLIRRAHWRCIMAMGAGANGLVFTIAVSHASMKLIDPDLPVRGFSDLVTAARGKAMTRIKRLLGKSPEYWAYAAEPHADGMVHFHCLVFAKPAALKKIFDIIEAELHKEVERRGGAPKLLSILRSKNVRPRHVTAVRGSWVLGALWYAAKAHTTTPTGRLRSLQSSGRSCPTSEVAAAWAWLNALPRRFAQPREPEMQSALIDHLVRNKASAKTAISFLRSAGRLP